MAEKFLKLKQHFGLKNNAEVIRFCIKGEFRRVAPELSLDLEHINLYDDHITVRDNRIGRYVDIYARNGVLWCELCETKNCEHIRFAVEVPEVERALEKRGWQFQRES